MESPTVSDPIDLDDLLTTHEAAVYLNLSSNTLHQWRWLGKGPKYLRLGNSTKAAIRYQRSELARWLAERRFANTSQYKVDKSGKLITPPWDVKHGASPVENSSQPSPSGGHAASPSATPPATPHE